MMSSVMMSSVMTSSLMRAARRFVHTDVDKFHSFLCQTRSSAPLISCGQNRKFASKQVKGHQKEPRSLKVKPRVEVSDRMTVSSLAAAMNKDCDHVMETLWDTPLDVDSLGPNTVLSEKWIKEVVTKSGMKVHWVHVSKIKEKINKDVHRRPPADLGSLKPRPPVVTIMGHVDHGKTTLLDSLRRSQVVLTEAGGITQHIGAFLVQLPSGEQVTFLDTPGHAAFSSMRARGAQVTDIIILVVAADDGVMNQTVESIQHAQRAQVPIIVAVNKCDRVTSDPQRVKEELLLHGVVCEEFGGDVQAVHVSALKGENLQRLTEATVALAEVMELRAEESGGVEGVVIESRTDKGKGPVTTTLVQRGTLQRGCVLVAGKTWAKVRFLFDENGRAVAKAGPSRAVQVVGWKEVPSAGEVIIEVESEQQAREVVSWRISEDEQQKMEAELSVIELKQQEHLESYRKERAELSHLSWKRRKFVRYQNFKNQPRTRSSEKTTEEHPRLPLVIKGDVDGSVETLLNVIDSYDAHEQCELDVIDFGVGEVSENDVKVAELFQGSIYGFNVAASRAALQLAAQRGVPLHLHSIIYRLVDQLKEQISSTLPPLRSEHVIGEAAVLALFESTVGKKRVPVAGCRVQNGLLDQSRKFRLIRGRDTVWEGSAMALRHHKDVVSTVKAGMECGLSVDQDVDFRPGDVVVCFETVESPQVTSWNPGF